MYSWIHPLSADQVEGGEGDAYIDFIINTLKPKIDNLYRTLPDREHTGIGGGTMGGLISVYAGLTRPDVFSRVIAMSPCVWFAENGGPWLSNNQLLNQIKNLNLPQDVIFHFEVGSSKKTEVMSLQPAVYDLLGNRITYEQAYAEGTKALVKALVNGAVPIENIKGEDQNSVEWVECIEQPFNWLLLEQARTDNLVYLPIIYKPNAIESPSRIETFTISMAQYFSYREERTIQVYLPPNYDTSGKSYPVIYIQDGQQLFNPTAIGDWRADETLDKLFEEGKIEGFIVVGIFAHPELKVRWDEYWIWTNNNMHAWVLESMANPVEGGKGKVYIDFIINTLKPKIDNDYRTLPAREHTAIGGSSMGALISIYAGLDRPNIFSKVMIMSTAVWFAEGIDPEFWLQRNQLLYYIDEYANPSYDQKYYFYVGTDEYSSPELLEYPKGVRDIEGNLLSSPFAYLDGTEKSVNRLKEKNINVYHQIGEGGQHDPDDWGLWLDDALLWLFSNE